MAIAPETLDTVSAVTDSGYKWGFETDIEMDMAPKGLTEDTGAWAATMRPPKCRIR